MPFIRSHLQETTSTANYSTPIDGEQAIKHIRRELNHGQNPSRKICLSKTYATPEGEQRTKLWTGEITNTGLILHWGREGNQQQQKLIPLSECQQHNPIFELESRATKKLRKGYVLISAH